MWDMSYLMTPLLQASSQELLFFKQAVQQH